MNMLTFWLWQVAAPGPARSVFRELVAGSSDSFKSYSGGGGSGDVFRETVGGSSDSFKPYSGGGGSGDVFRETVGGVGGGGVFR